MKIGILGGGQLGQMMSAAAKPLGIDVVCFDPAEAPPAALVGEVFVTDLTDTDGLRAWAKTMDVVTYEWENFPSELVADLAEQTDVRPSPYTLTVAQDRWAEKNLFNRLDIPVAPFRTAGSTADVQKAIADLDYPVVVKTRTGGYDGKGQVRVQNSEDLAAVNELLRDNEVIVEKLVAFEDEISIIGVRGNDGEVRTYPVAVNVHRNGILHTSTVPSGYADFVLQQAEKYMTALLKHLEYVGVLTLEMFVVGDQLMANEIAPRVHNSGHWTIEGAETSQFENHLRAVAGLPLGSTALRALSAMVNLIGTVPATIDVLQIPGAALHLYGKDPRPGRKLGHVTVTGDTMKQVIQRRVAVEALLNP